MKVSRLFLLATSLIIGNSFADDQNNQETLFINHNATIGIEAYGERNIDIADEEEGEIYFDYRLDIHKQFNDDISSFLGLKIFLPSGDVVTSEDETTFTDEAYLEAREFWVRYHGITNYENEHLTVGRQRLKEQTGLWFNRDIFSVKWQLDTTTYFYSIAIAKALDTFRSNNDELFTSLEDRTFLKGEIGYWINAGTRFGSRVILAKDNNTAEIGETYTDRKKYNAFSRWFSVDLSSDYFNYKNPRAFNYWVSASALNGTNENFTTSFTSIITEKTEVKVDAWAVNSAIRWKPLKQNTTNVGLLVSIASGGASGSSSNQFRQTGLHSNSGRYTGTSQKIRVFSESYRPEFNNIMVTGLFASYQTKHSSLSLLLNNFTRKDTASSAPVNSLRAINITNSNDLGQAVDLYWNHSFSYLNNSFLRASRIRTIISYFKTGNYYEFDDSYFTVKIAMNWRH